MPAATRDAMAMGIRLHQEGRLAEAEAVYREVLRADGQHPGALHLLGLTRFQQGDPGEAARLIGESIGRNALDPAPHNSLGAVLLALDRPDRALASFDRAVELKPDYAEAFNNGGNALVELGRPADALERYGKALQLGLRNATLLYNRGIALQKLGQLADAVASYDEAIALNPGYVDALANRGEALRLQKRLAQAVESFDRALALSPAHAQALNGRGAALFEAGRLQEALSSYEMAVRADPALADAHGNMAQALIGLRRFGEAVASCDRALALRPGHKDALRCRIVAMLELGRHAEALACADEAIAVDGDRAEFHFGRGMALFEMRRIEEALPSLGRALELAPGLPYAPGLLLHVKMQLCEWDGFEAACASVVESAARGETAAPPFAMIALPSSASAQLECSRTFARNLHPAAAEPLWKGEPYSHDRIRVAYFSADFRNHPVAHLVSGLLERHDRSRFEITAVSFGPASDDPWRRRIEAGVDRFVDAGTWTDRQAAALARDLEIDVAVDLMGFTSGARTGIFAMRFAPVQVNFLGFPGTMGTDYIDYLVADATVVPAEHEPFYAEKIACLPHCYLPGDPTRPVSNRAFGRAELGLPEHGVVFCCFNNSFKITPDVFESWMRLLRRLPGSVIWLRGATPTAETNLRRRAREAGISPDRLVFAGSMELADHLARHRAADLFLDTFHYNAHTTAIDALWAGLPVVSLMGGSFASRVGASLLRSVGLPELVARSRSGYEDLALALATDPERLASVRSRLAASRDSCPLFDTALFARHLEQAYSTMRERRRGNGPPARIVVPAKTP